MSTSRAYSASRAAATAVPTASVDSVTERCSASRVPSRCSCTPSPTSLSWPRSAVSMHVDAFLERHVHLAGQRVELGVLLVQVLVELVEATVDLGELVLQPIHPAADALEATGDAVQAAVQLRERRGQLVHDRFDRAVETGDRGVLGFQLGQRLVQPLGQHADLGAVRQFGQALADGAQRLHRREPGVDLVERVEDLLLLALTDFGRAVEHVPHAVEGHRRAVVLVHGKRAFIRGEERGDPSVAIDGGWSAGGPSCF